MHICNIFILFYSEWHDIDDSIVMSRSPPTVTIPTDHLDYEGIQCAIPEP